MGLKKQRHTLRDLWNNVNVSSVFILPLFNDIMESDDFVTTQIMATYGLINSYIYNDRFNNPYMLHLEFDKKYVFKKNKMSDDYRFCINDVIIDSKHFDSLCVKDKTVIYSLNIPKKYHKDIDIILTSEYSKVSNEYKEKVKVNKEFIYLPLGKPSYQDSICSYNLPYYVCTKDDFLKGCLAKELEVKSSDLSELFVKFNIKRETLKC